MKTIARAGSVLALTLALGACAARQPAPSLSPAAAAEAPTARLTAVQGQHASAPRTALIVLGIAALAVAAIVLFGTNSDPVY